MKTLRLSIILIFLTSVASGQPYHTLKVLFRYGSRPARGFEKTEKYDIGGIHGGHVCLGFDTIVIGFTSTKGIHIFPRIKHSRGEWLLEDEHDYMKDTIRKKYAIVRIPVSDSQYRHLNVILADYLRYPPYDYAFFGMRCASATYDVLSQIGIMEQRTYIGNIISNFYPRLLRRKIFRLAKEKNYDVTKLKGRKSRQWEQD